MTANSMRSFAGGLIVAAGLCGAVYFLGSDETTSSQTVDQPSVAEMKSLLTSEGYIIHTEEEWNDQLAAINKAKEDNAKANIKANTKTDTKADTKTDTKADTKADTKDGTNEKIVYRTILTVSSGMTVNEVGYALQKAKIIKKGSDFSKEVEKRKLESDLQLGTYKVESGMTTDEIIKVIFK